MPVPVEPWSQIVRLDDRRRDAIALTLEPDADARAALAQRLGLSALRKLRMSGTLTPQGARDWHLRADIGASVVQPCVVTLAPVTTRIEERVERTYLAQMPPLPEGDEIEMPDETIEPLPAALDLGAVMTEALALALPAWPRADGVELGTSVHAPPGVTPMRDEDARPFAGLKGLLDKDD